MVVTSRIHCALPCLALGTPVLFVPDGISQSKIEVSRLQGIVEYLNILTAMTKDKVNRVFGIRQNIFKMEDIDWNNPPTNPYTHKDLAKVLKNKCANFISPNQPVSDT